MINKSLRNTISAIALFGLSGIAFAGPADSDSLFNEQFAEQKNGIPSEYILSEMYTLVKPKSSAKKAGNPAENRTSRSASQGDNFQWVPTDWHSAY